MGATLLLRSVCKVDGARISYLFLAVSDFSQHNAPRCVSGIVNSIFIYRCYIISLYKIINGT